MDYRRWLVVSLWCLALLGSTAWLAAQDPTPSEEEALQAYRQGAFSRAVQLYTKALSETSSPEHRARLHIRIAWTLFALGREAEVDTHLQAALLEAPELTLVPDYYTQEFLDLFEQARARSLSGEDPGTAPPPPDLESTLASVSQRIDTEDDLEGALADVERLLLAYPSDGRLIPLKIQLLERMGRTAEADELRHMVTAPGGATLIQMMSIPDLILRANQHLDDGDVEASLELLREAVARQPSNVAALELMAEAARRAAQWQQAEFALKSALGLQPDNIGLKLRLGEVYLATGDASAARDVFRQLTERYPHSDRAWAALGLIDARLGSRERALAELEKALHENPLLPEVQLAYGELLLAENRITEALEALRSAANLLQEDPQVEARLGQVLLAKGQSDVALGHLRNAVAGGFTPPDVSRSLTLALIANGLFAEAERVLTPIAADRAGDGQILHSMLLLERGDLTAAEGTLRQVAEQRSNDPGVLNLLAASIYRQARFSEAATVLAQAHDLAPQAAAIEKNLVAARAAAAAVELEQAARDVAPMVVR